MIDYEGGREPRRRVCLRKVLAASGILIGLLLSILIGTAVSVLRYSHIDETRRADVAIVLGAQTYNGYMSEVFRERINHGIWLYDQGYVSKILFTGGYEEGAQTSESMDAAVYAEDLGVPPEDILVETWSHTTQENLLYAKMVMGRKNLRTALVVSDPLHMKRAMAMARDLGIEAFTSPTTTSRYVTWRTQIPFLLRETVYNIGYAGIRCLGLEWKGSIGRTFLSLFENGNTVRGMSS